MGIFLSFPRSILNTALPFTNSSTPVAQDLLHTAILIIALYYGPQIVDYYNHNLRARSEARLNPMGVPIPNEPDAAQDEPPIDEGLVLQDSDEEADPPPMAPTPPPGAPGLAEPPLPQAHEPEQLADWENDAGPANPDRPRPTPQNRAVGSKKAKSLARKDQRRAYHEFHRQEAELRRLQENEGREEREAALLAEKTRRTDVEREIQERERLEREEKKAAERHEAEEERLRRERVVARVRKDLRNAGACDLEDVAWEEGKDRLWAERLVRASGILSQGWKSADGQTTHTMITGVGWVVRVDAELVRDAYAEAVEFGDANGGKVSFAELGTILEKAVRARAQVSVACDRSCAGTI
jgi:hypothetical protein